MRFCVVLSLLLSIVSTAFAIFGGQDALDGEFPYQVNIEANTKSGTIKKCGGAIISTTHMLTTGYCVKNNKDYTIYYGAAAQGPNEQVTGALQKDVILHKDYNEISRDGDIATIKVTPPFVFGANVAAVPLPPKGPVNYSYRFLFAFTSGFGDKGTATTPVTTLQFASLRILENSACEALLKRSFDPFVKRPSLCANGNGTRNCNNDFGNPLVLDTTGQLAGLYSWSPEANCELNSPNVFTRITYYLPWIEKTTGVVNVA